MVSRVRILFMEPPKEFWFVMGEYLPPPLGMITLTAYLRRYDPRLEIEALDCQPERVDWKGVHTS